MNAAVRCFPGFVGWGGLLALAGTYHYFVKEIPVHADYEIFLHFGGWEEQKWVYLVAAFATKKHKTSIAKTQGTGNDGGALELNGARLKKGGDVAAKALMKGIPGSYASSESTSTLASETSKDPVPRSVEITSPETSAVSASADSAPPVDGSTIAGAMSSNDISGAVTPGSRSSLSLNAIKVPDGYTVNAVAVSQYCFKMGRITVVRWSPGMLSGPWSISRPILPCIILRLRLHQPPRVAFIACGFGSSHRWEKLLAIRAMPGGTNLMRSLLRGGWKDPAQNAALGLDEDFWDFKECEDAGRRAGDDLGQLRFVMGALAGQGPGAPGGGSEPNGSL